MRSSRPKPLHRLCGRPLVLHVVDALAELPVARTVVVVAHSVERVDKTMQQQAPLGLALDVVEQSRPRGTGDAVAVALTAFPDEDLDDADDVVVVPGDTPLLRAPTLAALVRSHREADAAATILTARLDDPTGYGRIVRSKDGRVHRIVEQAAATDEELEIDEINTGIYCFRRSLLAPALRRITPDNAEGDIRLTDAIEVLHDAGYSVASMVIDDPMEAAGVNDRAQLAIAEAELRDRINERWMRRGVTMLDPERTYIEAGVRLEEDVTLFPGTLLQGSTVVERNCELGPEVRLVDCTVGEGAVVEYTVGYQAEIGADAVVGPFARLGAGFRLAPGTVTGPFFAGEGAE
jgi:bifunctional UDP-N-acetylglucosamine pyrophosphorylase/glucosamine-1-phosphate N-acetyltransferase